MRDGLDLSLLEHPGSYKIVAIEQTRRSSQATTIHISLETRAEINALKKSVRKATGNQLTHDDVISHLLAAYRHTGVALCDW